MEKAVFTVIDGVNRGQKATLELFTCKVIGRHLDIDKLQNEKTVIMPKAVPLEKDELEHINNLLKNKGEAQGIPSNMSFDKTYRRLGDFIVGDESASRLHAMIFLGEQFAGIVDLGSTNGTKVNNHKVEIARLTAGDYITVGKTTIVYGDAP